jgi:glycosyltransferase involved in cell wall biosynthesis
MNILIFHHSNPFKESGIVASDLFNQFKKRGHEVKLLVNSRNKDYPDGIISLESFFSILLSDLHWKFIKILRVLNLQKQQKTDPNYYFFQLKGQKLIYRTKTLLKKAKIKPDLIFVLSAKNFVNIKNICELNTLTQAPVYWLMYDMAPLTGGCHYAWDCKGYLKCCGKCPALFSTNPYDVSYKNLLYKKNYIDRTNIQIIAGSEWQYLQAKMSTLFKNKPIHKMLITVDSSVFKPVDKEKLRMEMKISANKKIIFFGAVNLKEMRKGMYYLIESLKKLKERLKSTDSDLENNILLLVAGKNFDAIVDSLPFEFLYLEHVNNNYEIASAYQAADVFLCPSIEDSGPMMINQSIMSGTPVVSFEMGVSLDLVITGETGYRAKIKDSNDMAQGIYNILKLNSDDYNKLSIKCRELALKLYSPEAWIEIFENLIKNAE